MAKGSASKASANKTLRTTCANCAKSIPTQIQPPRDVVDAAVDVADVAHLLLRSFGLHRISRSLAPT